MNQSKVSSEFSLSGLRKFENTHILLWLMKDTCWLLDFQVLGLISILPTLGLALFICWKSRPNRSEFVHNLAVVCWIIANSTWMIGEFFFDDGTRPIAGAFFIAGLFIIVLFHVRQWFAEKEGQNKIHE